MTTKYSLEPHLKYPKMRFAYVQGLHHEDFPAHRHDFSELMVVLEGSATHTVGNLRFPLEAGDVFVINGETEHSFTEVNNLTLANLMFDSDSPIFDAAELRLLPGYQALFTIEPVARQKTDYTAKLNLTQEQSDEIFAQLDRIEQEYLNGPAGFETMLKAQLRQLVISLSRYYQGDQVQANSSTLVLSRALVFIEQNYQVSELKVNDIAASAFISTRQIERLFKSYLQESPKQYLRKLRLQRAASQLLAESDSSIQVIADTCGFSDSNYFAKCFRQHFRCSPREYRNRHNLS